MFLLFFFSFIAAHIMLISTAIRSIAVNSGALNYFDDSRAVRSLRRKALRKRWLITALLYATFIYAGINLY